MSVNPIGSSRGADEELKEALGKLKPHRYQCDCAFCHNFASVSSQVESLFSRIREERDRAIEKADMWLAASVSWEQSTFEARAELAALRSSSLTKEESARLVELLDFKTNESYDPQGTIRSKISGSGLEKGNNND